RTFTLPPNTISDQAQTVYIEQSKVIRDMAQKSDCVIVGRCADYVLRELSPFRLFIYADMKFKMERCRKKGQEKEILNDQELQRKIRSIDKARSKYYQFYTDQVWGDKKNYDLCINTSDIEIKRAVDAIEKFLPFDL
ncbi:MAG TPA: cytidylate kinase-like family protein, partial [Candidatus Egerieimonas intestinavium]|nr:cytidylate kinase-like family protein [Candidatus Egerieimonas intestinavium]